MTWPDAYPIAALAINYQPLTTILLYGQLRQFGRSFRLSVRPPGEATKALCVQILGFERFLSNAKSRGIEFAVFRGSKNLEEKELGFSGEGDIRIAPIVTGSKRGGALQTIIGAVLIVVGLVITGGSLRSVAIAKMLIAVGEGEFEGVSTAKDLDNTPLQDPQGNMSFPNVKWEWRARAVDQTYIQGIPLIENETTISTELRNGTPWVRAISNTQLSAVRVRFAWPALQSVDSSGNVNECLRYLIDLEKLQGGGGVARLDITQNGPLGHFPEWADDQCQGPRVCRVCRATAGKREQLTRWKPRAVADAGKSMRTGNLFPRRQE